MLTLYASKIEVGGNTSPMRLVTRPPVSTKGRSRSVIGFAIALAAAFHATAREFPVVGSLRILLPSAVTKAGKEFRLSRKSALRLRDLHF
jgi:hypothetical protein